MDRALIYSAFVVAGLNLTYSPALYSATQSASGRVERTANYTGQSAWSNTGPNTAPTISSQGTERYATQPTNNWQGNTTQSVTDRAQNAANSTANSLRDGFSAGTQGATQQAQSWSDAAARQMQTAGGSVRNVAEQTFGAPNLSPPSLSSPPLAPATSPRGSLAPPPAWPISAPTTLNDRSLIANPSTTPTTGGWTSIGTNVAAPPLLIPQLPGSSTNFNSVSNTTAINGPSLTPDLFPTQPSNRTFANDSPSPTTTTARSAPADDWTTSWNTPVQETSRPTSARVAGNPSFNNSGRESDLVPLQRASAGQDSANYRNDPRAADSWANDRLAQRQDPATVSSAPPNPAPASSKPSPFSFGNNGGLTTQPSLGQPSAMQVQTQSLPQSIPPTPNYAGPPPNLGQQMPGQNPANPNQPTAVTNASQPWIPLIAAVLALAGSLAGNLFLGWSYMDARQKYQSLVRRTADTFRRTKTAAA